MIKTAAKEGVILFALPPHTTHLIQPLDKGAFSPLKMEWRKAVHKFISANKGREVTIYDFNTVFSDAWYKGMSGSNVTSGFRCAGVFPFNRYAVKARSERERFQKPDVLAKESGISYLPMFSPAKVSHRYDNRDSEEGSECSGDSSDQSPQLPFIRATMPGDRLNRSLSDGNLQKYKCFLAAKKQGTLKEFLKTPKAPKRSKGRGPTPHGRVLTSRENLVLVEEQQRKKQDAARLKEERKRAREERQQMKLKKSGKSYIQFCGEEDPTWNCSYYYCCYILIRLIDAAMELPPYDHTCTIVLAHLYPYTFSCSKQKGHQAHLPHS